MKQYIVSGINERTNESVHEVIEYSNDLIALIDSYMFALIRNCQNNYSLFKINDNGSLTKIERI